MRPIGYYVHHHGDGHRQRALALAACDPDRFVLLGSHLDGRTAGIRAIDLPDDRLTEGDSFDGDDGEQERPQALHYAPLGHDGARARMAAIARWIATARPALIVVDVSVEIAMLARLCATPVAYVRLGGRRDDAAHLEAFRGAHVLIVPFASALDAGEMPDWIKAKSVYAPGIVARCVDVEAQKHLVLVVCGRGGSRIATEQLVAAARATPDHHWRVIGVESADEDLPSNLVLAGWSDDAAREIAQAGIVVGAAGDGLVGMVLATRRPFVCIAEQRPFDEQRHKATALHRAGAAVVLDRWPDAAQWADTLARARRIAPDAQARLDDPDGASRLATTLIAMADRQK